MMELSRNLKIYGVLLTGYTIVFHYYLSFFLEYYRLSKVYHNWPKIWITATVYGAVIFVTAWILGWKDPIRESRIHLAFHYHLITYVVCNSVSILWKLAGLASEWEHLWYDYATVLIWGVFLIAHYVYSRRTIKGMRRGEIFE